MSLPTPLPYREPTEQEVKTFSDAKESEDMQDLIDELAEVLDCNYDKETLCELVFAGNGIIRLNFTDGTKNTVGYEFIELSRARNLTGILVEPLTLTPTPEPEP